MQGRGRIRGGARWGEERVTGRGEEGGDGRPRAINIPKYAGNSRAAHAYVYACARARSSSRTSSELCQYMPSTYANCKYNLSVHIFATVRVCVRVRIVNVTSRSRARTCYVSEISDEF